MSTIVSATEPSTTDPDMGSADPVTKIPPNPVANDLVTVNATEVGLSADKKNAVVVLKINSDPGARTTVMRDGSVQIDASGRGTDQWTELTLNTADPMNWTIIAGTSGTSRYVFRKGNGGGGT